MNIIGRQSVIEELNQIYHSKKAELVAIYGRRRIGKTYLIRELYQEEWCFYHTGLSPVEAKNERSGMLGLQLQNFASSLRQFGADIEAAPTNWIEAFDMLIALLKRHSRKQRCVVFIDELPWMDTERSGFMTAFEHFWNGWASAQKNLMLIVCGSATSWMEDCLINDKGGLYGRVTCEIHLEPFRLSECAEYYRSKGIVMDRYDQLQCYMIMGGVPFYMDGLQKGKSLAQNIDTLFFNQHAPLRNEFDRLFASLFTNHEDCKKVVRLLAARREGFPRKEIAALTGIPYGGGLTNLLKSLKASDFITDYTPYNRSSRHQHYKLIDNFCLFYLKFIDDVKNLSSTFWQNNLLSPKLNAWRGFAFETVCFEHSDKIKAALGISGVHTEIAPWRSNETSPAHQIDMVIDRADRIVNICEMKFSTAEYTITKAYDKELREKAQAFIEETGSKKTPHLTMLTTYGLKHNEYSNRVQRSLSMDCLF